MNIKTKVMAGSFGSGGLLILLGLIFSTGSYTSIGNALLLSGIVVTLFPYGVFSYFYYRNIGKMENHFPSFLKDISESRKSGLSLPLAFREASKRDYGVLNSEIKKASVQLSWGLPFPEVLEKMIVRTEGSVLISRSLTILLQSYRSGGDISTTLDTLARDAMKLKESEEKRKAAINQHLITIYIIFFLFVFIIIALYNLGIVPLLSSDNQSEIFGQSVNFCAVNGTGFLCGMCPLFGFGESAEKFCYYKILFMFMIIIQGISNGLVAGQVSEGKATAGLKHSVVMTLIGFLIYMIAI